MCYIAIKADADFFSKNIADGAAAEKLELPVTIHMSPEVGFSYGVVDNPRLPLLENVLKTYPNLKILGHSQTFLLMMKSLAKRW